MRAGWTTKPFFHITFHTSTAYIFYKYKHTNPSFCHYRLHIFKYFISTPEFDFFGTQMSPFTLLLASFYSFTIKHNLWFISFNRRLEKLKHLHINMAKPQLKASDKDDEYEKPSDRWSSGINIDNKSCKRPCAELTLNRKVEKRHKSVHTCCCI